jgi:hypothetical protein
MGYPLDFLSGSYRGPRSSLRGGKLILDKGQSLCAVLSSVALMCLSVTAVTAVRIGGITVRLNLVGRWADKASRTFVELHVHYQF